MWHPTTNLICPLSVLSCHWSVRNEMHFPKLFDTLLNPMASGIPFKCSIHIHWHVQVIAKYIWSSYDHIQLGNYPFSCTCCRYKYLICAWINKLSCYLLGSVIWVIFVHICLELNSLLIQVNKSYHTECCWPCWLISSFLYLMHMNSLSSYL